MENLKVEVHKGFINHYPCHVVEVNTGDKLFFENFRSEGDAKIAAGIINGLARVETTDTLKTVKAFGGDGVILLSYCDNRDNNFACKKFQCENKDSAKKISDLIAFLQED